MTAVSAFPARAPEASPAGSSTDAHCGVPAARTAHRIEDPVDPSCSTSRLDGAPEIVDVAVNERAAHAGAVRDVELVARLRLRSRP